MNPDSTIADDDPPVIEEAPATDVKEAEEARPGWVATVAAALPVLLCFLGTGRSPWAYGLAAAVIGVLALAAPPKGRVPFSLLAAAGVIGLFTLLPMIPLPWPHLPAWRTALTNDFQVALPSTWSIQPLITFENWTGMALLGLWLFWTVCRTWTAAETTLAVRILGAGLATLACLALLLHLAGWKPPGWNAALQDIGPYANRNHFSCLMAMTALLCLGACYELQRRKNRFWMVYALGLVPAFAVTLLNTSRAGLVLFFTGTLLWVLTSSVKGGSGSLNRKAARFAVRLALSLSLMCVLIAGVVLFGRPILARFGGQNSGVVETLASDARLAVYAEAAPLAVEQPMTGLGLGNFGAVFGMIHQLPDAYTRYRHPESDWLWFLCEAGWPATFALLIGVILIFSWMEPWKPAHHKTGRRERRLRRAANLAFLLSLGHGVVDTPNHDLPHLSLVILTGALALRPSRLEKARGLPMPWLFRAGGVLALVAAGGWFATWLGMATPFGLSRSESEIRQTRVLLAQAQPSRAYDHACQAIAVAPANWEPYFLRAQAALETGRPESDAMTDFARSRYLEPHVTQTCMAEAAIWLRYAPMNALPAWREALRRDPPEAVNLYRRMLDSLGSNPELRAAVRDLANRPSLLVTFLATAQNAGEAAGTLQLIQQRYPSLEGLSNPERQFIVRSWQQVGDRKELVKFLAAHPALEQDTWQTKAQLLADEGRLEAAFRLLQQYVHPPVTAMGGQSENLAQLERDFQLYPSDPKRGLALYSAQRDKGQWDAALATLDKVAALPGRPRYVYFEMAATYAQKGDFTQAWRFAQVYLNTPG